MSWIHIDLIEFGGPEKLKVIEETILPEPKEKEIRVKVLTAGTGFTDTVIRQGQYVDVKEKPPFTLGYDWFGVIDKVGEGVEGFKQGDFVADMPVIGGYTQYLCVKADQVVKCPAELNPAEAVCMILSYGTAYQMLTRECKLEKGDKILVHAAGGAVGTALLELARMMGLEVYGTASKAKHDIVRSFGATPIDYKNEDFVERTMALSNGGVQAVFDTIGGKNWQRSYQCLTKGGKLVGFGALQVTTGEEKVPSLLWGFFKLLVLWKLLPNGKSSSFYNIQHRRDKNLNEFKGDIQTLMHWLKQGKLKPAVANIVPLEKAAEVHALIDSAQIAGKVVLQCNTL
jgi:NADPH:quinone reductase-like Zn-dependent oxidoreductase